MIFLSNPICLSYESLGHPERPFRVEASCDQLRADFPNSQWAEFCEASDESILRAHSPEHLAGLSAGRDFDADTAWHEGIEGIARLGTGAALKAVDLALGGESAFSVMRPPGHHATRDTVMGFCYLNHVAIAALEALSRGIERVAVWDFDAHHGNGTEDILLGREGALYVSAHQHPCYPGTGSRNRDNCLNFPVAPMASSADHMQILGKSWQEIIDYRPELVIVSAGFDAYADDPITQMTLQKEDFRKLGSWLGQSGLPVASVLEGGYSNDLPDLISAYVEGIEKA